MSIQAYADYVAVNVFDPAGVSGPTLDHPRRVALAYQFPAALPGWDSGDLRTMSGGAGWHLSVDELLNVMGACRRSGSILSASAAQAMLDASFGVDGKLATPAGALYHKNGFWQDINGHVEQAVLYFLPEDMELVLLANSAVGSGHDIPHLRDTITQIYVDHLRTGFVFEHVPSGVDGIHEAHHAIPDRRAAS